jgi:putative transposase
MSIRRKGEGDHPPPLHFPGPFYRWKGKYTGLGKAELQHLKGLEDENRHLKRMVAAHSLNVQILKDALGQQG